MPEKCRGPRGCPGQSPSNGLISPTVIGEEPKKRRNQSDPCHLVWQVKKILTVSTTGTRSVSRCPQNLIHLPDELAGVWWALPVEV